MRLLLDTHVVLWWLARLPMLGSKARAAIGSPSSEVYVSGITGSEIGIKKAFGRLEAPEDLPEQLAAHGFEELALTIRHGLALAELPVHHRDPFDRMLVAQARVEGLTLVTADPAMSDYDVRVLPAET
jgi:PIN domain nuclease of toxin-antitoxin system